MTPMLLTKLDFHDFTKLATEMGLFGAFQKKPEGECKVRICQQAQQHCEPFHLTVT